MIQSDGLRDELRGFNKEGGRRAWKQYLGARSTLTPGPELHRMSCMRGLQGALPSGGALGERTFRGDTENMRGHTGRGLVIQGSCDWRWNEGYEDPYRKRKWEKWSNWGAWASCGH